MGDETAQYLLSRLRTTREAIGKSVPDASCLAHRPMADGVALLLECREIEIQAAQERDAKAEADAVFRSRVQWTISAVVGAIGGAGFLKLLS